MRKFKGQLTFSPSGSVQEIWTISYPLIFSMFSINFMIFFDRFILAQYNIQAMNAAVVASLVFNIFQLGMVGIASISEVFVGQYNGAKKYKQIGEPIWQMIWFSLMTAFLFIPLGVFGGPFFITHPEYQEEGIAFFRSLMFFGPAFPLVAALSSFFIGRGQVKLVMVTAILSNIVNILLDYALIFGVNGIFPALGTNGAAIATGTAQVLQAGLLLFYFLLPKYRAEFGTSLWRFKAKLFWQTFRVGVPNAVASIVELSAWGMLAQVLASVSEAHITLYSIGDSLFSLFVFGFLGLQKGITTVSANYIGAEKESRVSLCLLSGVKIIIVMMLILIIPLFFFPKLLVSQFLTSTPAAIALEVMLYAETAMHWLWLYCFLEALVFLVSGVLTALGDTKYVMLMNGFNAWMVSVLPTFLAVNYWDSTPDKVWSLSAFYGGVSALSLYLRYRRRRATAHVPLHVLTAS